MKATRLLLIFGALIAIVFAFVATRGDDNSGTDSSNATETQTSEKPTLDAIKISLAYSPEKEPMLEAFEKRFNAEGHEAQGRKIFVDAQNWSSGKAFNEIAAGRFKPTVWSPSSSLWGRLLNYEADQPFILEDNPSLVRTPLVIAMWEQLARSLGWPDKQVTFKQILALSVDPQGWASVGKPTFGKFKLGHTNPDFSTSGLSFVAAQYYNAAGKKEGLTLQDVNAGKIRQQVRQIQSSVVHYGDTTLFFADQLKAHGPGYASAVAMEEATLIDFNRTKPKSLERMVALYPEEGSFVSDNPYLVLQGDWVTPAQKEAAAVFGDWLQKEITAEVAGKYGFRPGNPDLKPVAPINKQNGLDPTLPSRILGLPEPQVLAQIKKAWHEDRKPANVMLVVDVSGSMQDDDKIGQAKKGLQVFFQQLSPRDHVGLTYFSGDVHEGVKIAQFGQNRAKLKQTVNELLADGDTALYDATLAGVEAVESLKDATKINAVVVLSDGQDTASSTKLNSLLKRLENSGGRESERVRVFTIAYGEGADSSVLEKIAAAGGGKAYTGDPEEITAVYIQISSFF